MGKRVRWRPLVLVCIALLGFALRLYGLNWDDGNSFHPDERQILFHVTALGWPHSFAQFLDPVNSPLNPHFFAYGSFPLYLLALLGHILAHFFPTLGSFVNLTLVGRVLSALFDSGTILLTGCLALFLADDVTSERRYAWSLAFLSAALVAFTPFQLQTSHFYAVDPMLLFFVVLTLLACVVLIDTDAPIRWSLVAGLGYGLAMATKFSAAPLVIPLFVALLLRWSRYGLLSALSSFLLTIATTGLVFLIAMPYALLDFKNFVEQVAEQGSLARGTLDLPYVRQFAGTTPFVYEAQNMLLWGMGLMLGLAAFAGLLWLLWRVWRREASPWLVLLSWVIIYFAIVGSFYVKFMRYMLPIYPFLTLMGAAVLLALARYVGAKVSGSEQRFGMRAVKFLPYVAIGVVLAGTMFQGLALLNVYSQPNTRVQASRWMYSHIKPGSLLTYEQWDDPLPVPVGGHDPGIYRQAVYLDSSGQPQTGLDLYGDDTVEKAQQLANLLPTLDVITMATDRLDKSIPRLPFRYPLTIHYYQLLFSGQLGFHLAAQFENRPNLFGITLDDSNSDESYSVFDHPHVRIFVRDTPYPYTSAQLFQLLLQGVQLPPPAAQLSGAQRSLMLTPQQIADDQSPPPPGVQFPANSFSNTVPVFVWWLALALLGWIVFPVFFLAFRSMRDRGYIFSKTLGILLLAYGGWMLASLHLLAFSHFSLLIVLSLLLLCMLAMIIRQRHVLRQFLRQHWRLLLLEEAVFTLAFLLFVGIRSLNPDLWNPYLGGEKPMELALLNAVLRSPYMPPYDPWFAGGYINYYYYGYVIIGSLIKLTSIIPTTAFNLAIPTLFALTFSGVVSLVYSLTHRFSLALLGGYFAALIGNFNGLQQFKAQLAALAMHIPIPAFDYWQSSRIVPFTINEFPFWSFLFADLHPHVIDLPIATLMLGIAASLCMAGSDEAGAQVASQASNQATTRIAFAFRPIRWNTVLLYGIAAFVFGTIACVNTWDMPVYALMLGAVLLLRTLQERWQEPVVTKLVSLGFALGTWLVLCGLGYLLYLPFYASYQQLYVDGLGLVKQGTTLGDELTIFGLWFFLALSFFLSELYPQWRNSWVTRRLFAGYARVETWSMLSYLLLCGVVLILVAHAGVKVLLIVLIVCGAVLAAMSIWKMGVVNNAGISSINISMINDVAAVSVGSGSNNLGSDRVRDDELGDRKGLLMPSPGTGRPFGVSLPVTWFTYLLLLIGLCICLGQEVVYVRDFLDGGDYERMNTVFKFSMQAWLCFAVGGALVVWRLWRFPRGVIRRVWPMLLIALVIGCSIFLTEGTAARLQDHQLWIELQKPVQSANYTPTLDGFAFVRAWYPADAEAITWLNDNVSGSPIILEAAAPVSYQWFNRVSVYTGLPDVLGWPDHVGEQRYDSQPLNRETDISIIYTTPSAAQALELLRYYHVRYIYVGALERQLYGQQSMAGLDKFDRMVGDTLRLVYRYNGVTIYEVV